MLPRSIREKGEMATIEDDGEIDVEAERRLQGLIMGLKQQADQLMMADKFDDAIRLYRGLLVHLTKSQVKMATQKDLVISCRMNVLGAMSKLEQWREIPPECEHVFAFLQEIKPDLEKTMTEEQLGQMQAQNLGRVFYFRGFALLRLGAFAQSDHDFRVAMQMLPNVEAIKEDWKQVQGALALEQKIQELMNTAMENFQSNNFDVAAASCKAALAEAEKLGKHELTSIIHGNLAAAYARAEKDDDAIKHYNAAIELTKKLESATWNDRLFDLLEGVTGAYMRKEDAESAYATLQESSKLFPKTKDRQERAQPHFLNHGRMAFALGKFDEAEKHFTRVEKNSTSSDERLHVLSWLGKVYLEQKAYDKLQSLLDRSFAITIREEKDEMHAVFLFLWLPMLEERVALHNETLSEEILVKLSQAYQFFGHRRILNGLLRSGLLMVAMWKDEPQHRAKRDEVLKGLDAVQIEGLVGMDADLFSKMSMIRADVATSQGDGLSAFAALKHALKSIKKDAETHDVRVGLLRRFAFLYVVQSGNGIQDDEEIMDFLDESLAVLRGDDTNVAILSSALVRVSQWEMQKPDGDITRADELLQESAKALKAYVGNDSEELLCQTLVGQCVLSIRRGDKTRAQEIMNEIESHEITASWSQLDAVRQQISSDKPFKPAATPKKKEVDAKPAGTKTETPVEAEQSSETASTAAAVVPKVGFEAWWDEYWFAVSVTIVAIIFALIMMQDQEQEK